MPFTPSHAVIALPFVRTPLVPAAIAIGAMAPDLPLFIRRMGITYAFTHNYANLLWTALLAFALFAVWRLFLRPAVPELLPDVVSRRLPASWRSTGQAALPELSSGTWGPPLWLGLSALLGVLSHIVWDSFTHEGRAGVTLLPVLDQQWGPLLGYKWLQHGSSVLGLVILGIYAVVWLSKRTVGGPFVRAFPRFVRWSWMLALPVLLGGALIWGWIAAGGLSEEFTIRHLAYAVLPPACAIWGGLTLALCLWLRFRRRIAHQRAGSAPHRRGF